MYKDAVAKCSSCNAVYKIPATVKILQVEVCANCHPIYTGEYRGLLVSGRVDRFRKATEATKKKQAAIKVIEDKRKAKPAIKKKAKKTK